MIKTSIKCGVWHNRFAEVSHYHALKVTQETPDVPEVWTANRYVYLNWLLWSTWLDSGTTNMNVNWSVTSQEFYILSHSDYDIHITDISIIIADTAVAHNNFWNVSTLWVWWDLIVSEHWADTHIIKKAQTGWQVIAQSWFAHPYWDAATSFELSNWTGTSDAQTINIPIHDYIPGGIRIWRWTKNKLKSIINDDLTWLTEFYVRVIWYKHYP